MSERSTGLLSRLRIRPKRSGEPEPRSYRLANSIRVPWAAGIVSLLILATGVALLVGRTDEDRLDVPQSLLDYQENLTNTVAQSLRKSVNEGVYDLEQHAQTLAVLGSDLSSTGSEASLAAVEGSHDRYVSLFLVDAEGDIVAQRGDIAAPEELELSDVSYDSLAVFDAVRAPGGEVVIPMVAPIPEPLGGAVVGYYDPGFLQFPLEAALPGEGWVLNDDGLVLGGAAAPDALTKLPRDRLRDIAGEAVAGDTGIRSEGGSLDQQELVGAASVSGLGPAGELGWTVITARSVASFSLPQTDVRRQALLAGVVLGLLTLMIFGWLYIVVLAPVVRAQREAERIAFGDLSKPVEVVRYDEIGLIARALERIRINLIRRRVEVDRASAREDETVG